MPFCDVFSYKPIIGMTHLAGDDPVGRALEELDIYEAEGITGAIVENYHGEVDDVAKTLEQACRKERKLVLGVNILPNEFCHAFALAHQYGCRFIQLDHVAGHYHQGTIPVHAFADQKQQFPNVIVLGGVHPKYYELIDGSDMEKDVREGVQRAEAIVVTGKGTGRETPLGKIATFRNILGSHPLIVGAGMNPENAYEQLTIADGAIVGSAFKERNDTSMPLDRKRIREFMRVVHAVRQK